MKNIDRIGITNIKTPIKSHQNKNRRREAIQMEVGLLKEIAEMARTRSAWVVSSKNRAVSAHHSYDHARFMRNWLGNGGVPNARSYTYRIDEVPIMDITYEQSELLVNKKVKFRKVQYRLIDGETVEDIIKTYK
jgi:hypothetical protein